MRTSAWVRRRVGAWAPVLGVLGSLALGCGSAAAQEMPDPAQIHGRAIPAPELPNGTVTVRVVREAIGNNVPGQRVRVTVGSLTRTATTDELGRAEFTGLPGGDAVADAAVDGEPLVSQPFPVPTTGGLRVILVAGMAQAAERRQQEAAKAAAAPAVKGAVVLGSNSRVIMEFSNDTLTAFYVLEIVNNARTRVDVGEPIAFDLPEEAVNAQPMEGSSPQATVKGRRVTIAGPFAAGVTAVQIAFRLAYSGSQLTFRQTWPVALQQVTAGIQKVGNITMTSPQFATSGDVTTERGQVYVLGSGPALAAGTPMTITFDNLPSRSTTPRNAAVAIAIAIAAVGVWLGWLRPGGRRGESRQALVQRREALLAELEQVEARRQVGAEPTGRQAARRRELLAELEQIYGELDDASSGPSGGGEGIAA